MFNAFSPMEAGAVDTCAEGYIFMSCSRRERRRGSLRKRVRRPAAHRLRHEKAEEGCLRVGKVERICGKHGHEHGLRKQICRATKRGHVGVAGGVLHAHGASAGAGRLHSRFSMCLQLRRGLSAYF